MGLKIGTFHVSFTLGYALAFFAEVITTTLVRLGVFKIWEPAIFNLTPEVPSIILPWVLREKQYKPKRITLFAADFAASCIASPVIEEVIKLKVVQWTCRLPRNFRTGNSSKGKGRKKCFPVRSIDSPQVTNINCYITQVSAIEGEVLVVMKFHNALTNYLNLLDVSSKPGFEAVRRHPAHTDVHKGQR